MKKQPLTAALLIGTALTLTGCIDRDEANAKLQKGCEAAIKTLISAPFELEGVTNPSFEEVSYGEDTGLRKVTLTATETDGWLTRKKEFNCVFTEFLGFFNMRHSAELYRLEIGKNAFGKGGGADAEIDKWLELRNAAKDGMK